MAKLIGWREWISLPQLDIERVKVKVDTGARTSALHAVDIQTTIEDDTEWVSFRVHPLQDNTVTEVPCRAPVVDRRVVRDSGGHEEERIVIATEVLIGDDRFDAELTLTDRETMGFRMLLGRAALNHRYYVDPTNSFLLTPSESSDADFKEEEEEEVVEKEKENERKAPSEAAQTNTHERTRHGGQG